MRILISLLLLLFASPNALAQTDLSDQVRAEMAACSGMFNSDQPTASSVFSQTAASLSSSSNNPNCRYDTPENFGVADADPLLVAIRKILDDDNARLQCRTTQNAACPVIAYATMLMQGMTYVEGGSPAPIQSDFRYESKNLFWGVGNEAINIGRLIFERGAPIEAAKFTINTDIGRDFSIASTTCVLCQDDARAALPYIVVIDALRAVFALVEEGPTWGEMNATAKQNSERWDAYHFGGGQARTPLPWELLVNGALYSALGQPKEGPLVDSLPEAPDWSVTFLHPSIGITPFDDAGADSTVVGVVELLGYSWWDYGDDNKRTNEWGISAVSVFQPRDNGKDWNYGLLLRTPVNGLNVVWSRVELDNGEDEDVFAFSIDPSTLFESFSGGGLECVFGLKTC